MLRPIRITRRILLEVRTHFVIVVTSHSAPRRCTYCPLRKRLLIVTLWDSLMTSQQMDGKRRYLAHKRYFDDTRYTQTSRTENDQRHTCEYEIYSHSSFRGETDEQSTLCHQASRLHPDISTGSPIVTLNRP